MKKILIAAVSVFGFVGVASAQQAPFLFGNYSPNVLNEWNEEAPMAGLGVDTSRTASIDTGGSASIGGGGGGQYIPLAQQIHPDWKPCLDIVSAQSCASIRSGR